MDCILPNITEVIRCSMTNKIPILLIEIKIDREMSQLLNFIKVQSAKDTKTCLLPKYIHDKFYINYQKPSYTMQCINYIEFPIAFIPSDNFWLDYAY